MKKGSSGHFISIEGIEGCGKSTQAALLGDWLGNKGLKVLLAREPGGPAISEKIREILLDPVNASMDHRTELLLYLASRSQFVQEFLLPAIQVGKMVIVDRYIDSTLAYQGYGRGLDVRSIELMNSFASRDLVPELTILLDLDPVEGLRRKGMQGSGNSAGDRLEMESLEFHRRVREGFLAIAGSDPERVVVLRAENEIWKISSEIKSVFSERFDL